MQGYMIEKEGKGNGSKRIPSSVEPSPLLRIERDGVGVSTEDRSSGAFAGGKRPEGSERGKTLSCDKRPKTKESGTYEVDAWRVRSFHAPTYKEKVYRLTSEIRMQYSSCFVNLKGRG